MSLMVQLAIIFAAIGVATLGVLAIMSQLSQPTHLPPAPYVEIDP